MTVQFDQSGFVTKSGPPSSPSTVSGVINVGAGANGTSNRALVAAICFAEKAAGTISGASVTWNGVSMTSIISQSTTVSDTFVFGLVAPDTGANNFVVTWTGAAGGNFDIAALSVVGADQTGGTTTFAHSTPNTAGTNPSTVTVTSATGNICFAVHTVGSNYVTASGTDIGHNNVHSVAAFAANRDAGAASVTLTYSNGGGTGKSLGVDIVAAGGGGGSAVPTYMHRTQQMLN